MSSALSSAGLKSVLLGTSGASILLAALCCRIGSSASSTVDPRRRRPRDSRVHFAHDGDDAGSKSETFQVYTKEEREDMMRSSMLGKLGVMAEAPGEEEEESEEPEEPEDEPRTIIERIGRRISLVRATSYNLLLGIRDDHNDTAPEFWTYDDVSEESPIRLAMQAMKIYVQEYKAAQLDPFWHRKSKQTVLSTIVCKKEDGGHVIHRGMNTEVSLPSGSLCAERAGIARAASDFHHASSIVAIAVCDPSDRINPLWPCEVCQSWLAKLRDQSHYINVMAVESSECEAFAVQVNGRLRRRPRADRKHVRSVAEDFGADIGNLRDRVERAEGEGDWPWQAKELVYVDGAWCYLHRAQQHILQVARKKGTHLLVGIHSDDAILQATGEMCSEDFVTRVHRVLGNRNVTSVLRAAPWIVSAEMIEDLGIKRVITGTVSKFTDIGAKDAALAEPYAAAKELGILEEVPSLSEMTERSSSLSRRGTDEEMRKEPSGVSKC